MFSWLSLRDVFLSSLRTSIISIKGILRSPSCASATLHFSEPAVLRLLGSSGDRLPWLLLFVFLMLASRHVSGFGMFLILDDDVWSLFCGCPALWFLFLPLIFRRVWMLCFAWYGILLGSCQVWSMGISRFNVFLGIGS